jgi:toxin ParE1/3/4|tara:strand:- start:2379 stop:2675 length:297 start_codon:yes stop_codon:yes gene_type:complete
VTIPVRFNAAAGRDLADIAVYTEGQWGTEQAKAYVTAIADAIDRIAAFANIGSAIEDVRGGYRKLRVESHNIYYRQKGGCVEIVRILHQRADHLHHLE